MHKLICSYQVGYWATNKYIIFLCFCIFICIYISSSVQIKVEFMPLSPLEQERHDNDNGNPHCCDFMPTSGALYTLFYLYNQKKRHRSVKEHLNFFFFMIIFSGCSGTTPCKKHVKISPITHLVDRPSLSLDAHFSRIYFNILAWE